jgi:antitoxin (DNA-binding transcriptional repressor) of toxin-antitoxin stability system
MIKVNIHEAKTHLSKYLSRLKKGEVIVLCRRNAPIAEIRPLPEVSSKPRPLGIGKGTVTIKPGFYEPLPDEELALFEGEKP